MNTRHSGTVIGQIMEQNIGLKNIYIIRLLLVSGQKTDFSMNSTRTIDNQYGGDNYTQKKFQVDKIPKCEQDHKFF